MTYVTDREMEEAHLLDCGKLSCPACGVKGALYGSADAMGLILSPEAYQLRCKSCKFWEDCGYPIERHMGGPDGLPGAIYDLAIELATQKGDKPLAWKIRERRKRNPDLQSG